LFVFSGNRKALVEKSGLVKHSANKKGREPPKQPIKERRNNTRRWVVHRCLTRWHSVSLMQ